MRPGGLARWLVLLTLALVIIACKNKTENNPVTNFNFGGPTSLQCPVFFLPGGAAVQFRDVVVNGNGTVTINGIVYSVDADCSTTTTTTTTTTAEAPIRHRAGEPL